VTLVAAAGPSAYWYLARGTGAVALVLLTASVVLGVLGSIRFSVAPRWPRFAIDTLHRDVSLLVIVLLVAHIITSVLDSFAPIRLTDAIIPFAGVYRPLWLGLGALSFDVLIALVVTSLLRRRLGYTTWRAVHWFAYASWPIAVLHGLGTGSDTKIWWMLGLTVACGAAVVIAVMIRIRQGSPSLEGYRTPAMLATIVAPLAILIFALQGPLQTGWARRAGTPASLLAKTFTPASARTPVVVARTPASATHAGPFSSPLVGTITQTNEPDGAIVDLTLRLTGGTTGRLRVRIAGAPIDGGGLSMTGSQVVLAATGLPSVMQGRILSLQGQQFLARVAGAGSTFDLRANLNIDGQGGGVTGTLSATPAGSGG
jgi:sulfoxide reductase heme-binding subunit YedZ